jgi:hypothetical protein
VAAVRQTIAKRPELLAEVDFAPAEKKILIKAGLWAEVELAVNGKGSRSC